MLVLCQVCILVFFHNNIANYFILNNLLMLFSSGKSSWLDEFKRLTYHTPLLETEVLLEHSHQVLHVSFSHNGKMFATCSKDGYVLVN